MKLEAAVQVAFHVFYTKTRGPFLSYCVVPNAFAAPNFSDKVGVQFGSTAELVETLDRVGLPGLEISTALDGRPYSVGAEGLQSLRIQV